MIGSEMHQPTLSNFVRQYPLKSFKKNETIIFQDDQPTTVYYITSGFVKGYDIDSQGSEQILWLGTSGDFFPAIWAFQLTPNVPYFFSAFTDVETHAIPRLVFKEFIDTNHQALIEVTGNLATRLNDTYRHLNAAEKAKTDEKIAHGLYYLARRFANIAGGTATKISLPLTHQDIASLVGLTRETVTQELKKLKDHGFVFYDKNEFTIYTEKIETLL